MVFGKSFPFFLSFTVLLLHSAVRTALADENRPRCTLCPEGKQVVNLPDKTLNVNWPVSVQDCNSLNEYAGSLEADSNDCAKLQTISTVCGCPERNDTCRICPGTGVSKPSLKLGFLAPDFDGIMPTCETFAAHLHSIDSNSQSCFEAQFFGFSCGCPMTQNEGCKMCRNGESISYPNKRVPEFGNLEAENWDINPPTCQLIEAVLYEAEEEGSDTCTEVQEANYVCGCELRDSLRYRLVVLTWLPRVSATLSLFGSLFIIYDITKKGKNQQTTKHHLLLGMSAVDCMSSIAWGLSSLPSPATINLYGTKGSEATCTAQGFFIQLGVASPFFNLALAVYYILIISYGWNEERMKKVRWWMYIFPFLSGLGLACGGIPFYGSSGVICYLKKHDVFFLVIPISIVTICATLIMAKVYCKVYSQERASRRWVRGRSNVQSLPQKVAWQAFWYLMCFYVSWPILAVASLVEGGFQEAFAFHCVTFLVAPLQGFLNFIAYTRPRIQRYIKQSKSCSFTCSQRFRHQQDVEESIQRSDRVEYSTATMENSSGAGKEEMLPSDSEQDGNTTAADQAQ